MTVWAAIGSHSSKESIGRKGRASMRESTRTHCSDKSLPSSFAAALPFESGGVGVGTVDAPSDRIRTSSRSVDDSKVWSADIGEGGDVILIRLLKAILNCLGDRFCGNTYVSSGLI